MSPAPETRPSAQCRKADRLKVSSGWIAEVQAEPFPADRCLEQTDRTPHSYAMAREAPSLADRWSRLRISTKAFAVASGYMLAMVALSEIAGDGLLLIWFATALPISWCGGLLLHWASMRPRPSLDDASKGIVAQAKGKPILFAAYAVAAVVIEAFAVIEALKADQ